MLVLLYLYVINPLAISKKKIIMECWFPQRAPAHWWIGWGPYPCPGLVGSLVAPWQGRGVVPTPVWCVRRWCRSSVSWWPPGVGGGGGRRAWPLAPDSLAWGIASSTGADPGSVAGCVMQLILEHHQRYYNWHNQVDNLHFANDKFKIDNELCLLLTNIANSGDFVVSNVLGTATCRASRNQKLGTYMGWLFGNSSRVSYGVTLYEWFDPIFSKIPRKLENCCQWLFKLACMTGAILNGDVMKIAMKLYKWWIKVMCQVVHSWLRYIFRRWLGVLTPRDVFDFKCLS